MVQSRADRRIWAVAEVARRWNLKILTVYRWCNGGGVHLIEKTPLATGPNRRSCSVEPSAPKKHEFGGLSAIR